MHFATFCSVREDHFLEFLSLLRVFIKAFELPLSLHEAAAIYSDSHLLLKMIQSDSFTRQTTLLGIPGRQGIAGIEEADAYAKQSAAFTDGAPLPVALAAASEFIRH